RRLHCHRRPPGGWPRPARPAQPRRAASQAAKPLRVTQIALATGADLAGFRQAVRKLAAARFPPEEVSWTTGGMPTLFPAVRYDNAPAISLPRGAHDLIRLVVCHRDP